MTILDRYVFREWLKVFAMGLLSMLGLLLVVQMYTDIKRLQDGGFGAGETASYFLWQVPQMLPIVLPVTLLVTLLYTLGNMHKNQEITAMRAAGLSLWRITRTYWVAGIACVAALMTVNTVVIPLALKRTRAMSEEADFRGKRGDAATAGRAGTEAVVFNNGRDSRRWRIAALGGYANEAFGVSVYELDDADRPVRQVFAKHARYDTAKGYWIFDHGREIVYRGDGADPGDQPAFIGEKAFPQYTEKPIYMQLMAKKAGSLSFGEIGTLIGLSGDLESAKIAALQVRYHSILAWPFSCLVVVAMAIPFAVAGVRTNPMVGVSKSIGVFALYYLSDRVGFALGSQQIIPAMLAAWLPNLCAMLYAIPLCLRAN